MARVMVSGFFDVLHVGYIDFLSKAAGFGELYVSVGTDSNSRLLRGSSMTFSEKDRVKLVQNVKSVKSAFVSNGGGVLDFVADFETVKPDLFCTNPDGHHPSKEAACKERGIEYKVLDGAPAADSGIYHEDMIENFDPLRVQYRLSLSGGWIDQPWVSSIHPGSMVVVCLKPTHEFARRAGMATSTRQTARGIWSEHIPSGDPEKVARILFGAENPPGSKYISGSQDPIGLVYPGFNRLYYDGSFWPKEITSLIDKEAASWIENVIQLVPIAPRPDDYDPLVEKNLDIKWVKLLGDAGQCCWEAIQKRDIVLLGRALNMTLEAWQNLLPMTVPDHLLPELSRFDSCHGRLLSGCGGGFIIVAEEKPIDGAIRIKVKNK